jgi:hypothetical protein
LLRRIFGPKRDDVTGEWRRLHNKELCALYSLPNIIRVIKSGRMIWAGHMASMAAGHKGFWWGDVRKRGNMEDAGVDGREDNIKTNLQEVRWGGMH